MESWTLWILQWAAPYSGLACWLQHNLAKWWETQPVRSACRLQSTEWLKEDLVYLFAFANVYKCWNFDNHFYLVVFKTIFANVLILVFKVLG